MLDRRREEIKKSDSIKEKKYVYTIHEWKVNEEMEREMEVWEWETASWYRDGISTLRLEEREGGKIGNSRGTRKKWLMLSINMGVEREKKERCGEKPDLGPSGLTAQGQDAQRGREDDDWDLDG